MPRNAVRVLPLRQGKSLSTKFLLGTAAGLVAVSLVFLFLFITMYRARLEQDAHQTALQLNRLFQATLENAMLKRDIDGLREIVQRLGAQERIASVMILHPSGEIRFSSDRRMLGQRLDGSSPGRPAAGPLGKDAWGTIGFMMDAHGREVLRSAIAVPNRAECLGCHGTAAQNPVNGVLLVDYDAAPIRSHARNTTLALMGAGAVVVVVTLLGGWWFMRRYVLKPVAVLTEASRSFASGNLGVRVQLEGHDELAQLAGTFNRMAEDLDASLKATQRNEAFLQSVIDGIPDGVRVIGADYRIIKANRAFHEMTGNPNADAVGRPCYETSHNRSEPCPATLVNCPLDIISSHGSPVKFKQRFVSASGKERHVEVYAAPVGTLRPDETGTVIVESIRDLEQAAMFSHEEKLSALGQLAAGVAHEIHNPLCSIRFALQASIRSFRQGGHHDPEEIQKHLALIDMEIDRCIEITGRLLKLGTLPSERPELVSVNSVLMDTVSLMHNEGLEHRIDIQYDLDPSNPRIVAADADLRMVVLNLTQNAFHSMPAGGRLGISTRCRNLQVELLFDDAGAGVDPADLQRVFDPFFSRRADGTKGAGLGLAIVKNLVEKHRGRVALEPLLPQGTRARVVFPAAQSSSEPTET